MAETTNEQERRASIRYSIPNAMVQFRKSMGGPPKRFVCPLVNIGRGGAVMTSPVQLEPDERLVVTLNLPKKSNYLKLVSRARWSESIDGESGFRVGVVFDRYGSSTEKRLAHLEMQFGFLAVSTESDPPLEDAVSMPVGYDAPQPAKPPGSLSLPANVPPEFADILDKFHTFEFDLEAARDVLDVVLKGSEFDGLTRSQEDDERSELIRTLVPVHEMGESVPAAFDALGVPIGEPVGYVFLPNTTSTATFALQVSRTASLSPGPPRFAKRDLLLFCSEPAKDFDHVFLVAGSQAWFGQVFFDREGEVRLRPPNSDFRECRLRQQEVTAVWRMSAKVEHY